MIDLVLTMDDDGYPTEETERLIREFNGAAEDLLAAVKTVWHFPSFGWKEHEGESGRSHLYHISTGGWSGNETLISALHSNHIFWSLSWLQSQRGGHYIFEVSRP